MLAQNRKEGPENVLFRGKPRGGDLETGFRGGREAICGGLLVLGCHLGHGGISALRLRVGFAVEHRAASKQRSGQQHGNRDSATQNGDHGEVGGWDEGAVRPENEC